MQIAGVCRHLVTSGTAKLPGQSIAVRGSPQPTVAASPPLAFQNLQHVAAIAAILETGPKAYFAVEPSLTHMTLALAMATGGNARCRRSYQVSKTPCTLPLSDLQANLKSCMHHADIDWNGLGINVCIQSVTHGAPGDAVSVLQ